MIQNLRSLLLTALVAFSAGILGVWLGRCIFSEPHRPSAMHELMHSRLKLSPAQQQQISQMESAFKVQRAALEAEMRAANADLAHAIREEHGFGPNVTAAVARFHKAMEGLQTATLQHVFSMRDILPPDQRKIFDDTVTTALIAEGD